MNMVTLRLRPPAAGLSARPVRRLLAVLALVLGGAVAAQAQTGQIAGVVTDSLDATTLPAASVVVLDDDGQAIPTLGASTGAVGEYEIRGVPAGAYTVRASFIGYAPQERAVVVRAGETAMADFALVFADASLGELVVVGYGEQRRRDVTGAVSSVSGEELAEQATPSVAQALQGRVAGVQVTPSSGAPGSGAQIRIRGVGTLNNASPLYVVDGLLLDDIDFLNPNDVESIEVLKDASATAIYGSRGANGVILITTKKGGFEAGTTVSVDVYNGVQSLQREIALVSGAEYAQLANELAANTGLDPFFADPSAVVTSTDWQDQVYQTAPIRNLTVSARGGNENISYYVSGDVISQDGILQGSSYQRATLRLNNEYRLGGAAQIGHNINLIYRDGERSAGVVRAALLADPTVAPMTDGVFNDAGVRSSAGNPAASIFYNRNDEGGFRLAGNVFLDLDLPEGIGFRSNFAVDLDDAEYKNFVPVFLVSPTQQNETSRLLVEQGNTDTWLWENTLTYDLLTPDDRHRLDVLGGFTLQSYYTEEIRGRRQNLIGEDPSFWYLRAGEEDGQTVEDEASSWTMQSYLARANYSFLDRYLATVSVRVDGSSRFGENNRYGTFPSIGLGWNVADEPFMDGVPYVSAFKLRGSYGRIGNDKIDPYASLALVDNNLNAVFGGDPTLNFGQTLTSLANPDIQWESVVQTDVGLDAAFFDDRLTATFDYYRRDTEDILVRVPIPDYVGSAQNPFVNAASVRNSGFETSLGLSGTAGDFLYGVRFNGSTIHNEVLALGEGNEEILAGGLGNEVTNTNRTIVGEPIGSFYGFQVEGVFQTQEEIDNAPTRGGERPGDLRFADTNGDGTVTNDDKVNLGSPIPDYTLGFGVDLGWNGFDVSAAFTGSIGADVYNARTSVRFGVENYEESFLDRWTGPGTSDTEPRITNAGHNFLASSRFVEDASFLKLQTLQVGYAIPAQYANRIRVDRARIYVSGTNLFTLTGYDGYTPEIGGSSVLGPGIDNGVYPIARTITVGLNLSF
ncbi:TonB-dependent receptor [Rubrivirga sp. S365]|uniref:TonB-dependent receptor n=1 Tax=Rubrivirga litoralis TaxID=3075598 RepID=A0ABU3BNZ5_9BACT|nr:MULTISPECIES: TonB-dependent receptor [unclassified Rubrivirga]MDT0631012.1 TonB-dependent receptor [Rubrivirga sp. F394]MDT7855038.1 TonB-dependent receptor [Rubrivirga sp. S365]